VTLPQLFMGGSSSLFDIFESFFSYRWHRSVLFDKNEVIEPEVLLTLLCVSMWQSNLQLLKSDIEDVSFREMRKQIRLQHQASGSVNDRLHDRRAELSYLRREIAYLRQWMKDDVKQAAKVKVVSSGFEHSSVPFHTLLVLIRKANSLQNFLMDTSQLWMAILQFENTLLHIDQARDSNKIATDNNKMVAAGEKRADKSTRQTGRATALTFLAAIYLPMTLASGLFGMNIREVSGDSDMNATLNQFAGTLVALVVATVVAMLVYYYWWEPRAIRKQQSARDSQEEAK